MVEKVLSEEERAREQVNAAREKAAEITREAEQEAGRILDEAREEARRIIREGLDQAEGKAKQKYHEEVENSRHGYEHLKKKVTVSIDSTVEEVIEMIIHPGYKKEE